MIYNEIKGNLFEFKQNYALVHCISADCKMGAGIAVEFVKLFPLMKHDLLMREPKVGQALYYSDGLHDCVNLITKQKYFYKPTSRTFRQSIESLKEVVVEKNIRKIAMPLIGAGLDKLKWEDNRTIIQNVFKDVDVDILVCIK